MTCPQLFICCSLLVLWMVARASGRGAIGAGLQMGASESALLLESLGSQFPVAHSETCSKFLYD